MSRNIYVLLLINLSYMTLASWAQRSPYSLQTAVDELHHWDAAKFPLNSPPSQSSYYRSALGTVADQDYWDDDFKSPQKSNRHKLSKALAKYLERENYDSNNVGLKIGPFNDIFDDESPIVSNKRSPSFRQHNSNNNNNNRRDNEPSSIFRERETQSNNNGNGNTELTDEFLREIEEVQEREREQRYKNALRHLWEKYQTQNTDVANDLFTEKKRMRVPPYYMLMSKKSSSYPMLPWLPSNKERFSAVTKRSTKHEPTSTSNDGKVNFDKTDERMERELSEMFGLTEDVKTKRSAENEEKLSTTNSPLSISSTSTEKEKTTDSTTSKPSNGHKKKDNPEHEHSTHGHEHDHEHGHKHRKRSNSRHSGEDEHNDSDEEEEEDSEEHEHGDEHEDDEDEDDFGDEEDEQRKKKRDVTSLKAKSNEKLVRQKKAIQWSKYFGIDRKRKAPLSSITMKKRSTSEGSNMKDDESRKRNLNTNKLENMDKKIQNIENLIIDETIKYTGSHEGITNPLEVRRLKDNVLSRLATAYSLEKMRLALEKLRQNVDNENHLLRNVIEPDSYAGDENESTEYQNYLMTKKEKNINEKSKNMEIENKTDEKPERQQYKKKRTNYQRYSDLSNNLMDVQRNTAPARFEPLNDMYLGNKNYIMGSNQCPIIETMAERCRGVDILSGDFNQELLPICGVHQICYLCGTSQISCDYQYLTEADAICGNNDACQAAARSVLMILRGAPGPQLGPRECGKSTCLYGAMREMGL